MTVANFLNFSRAAEVLRITQPAVSHQINALENELGVKLFHRTSKSVRLTQAGYLFTQYADEILPNLRPLQRAIESGPRSTLRSPRGGMPKFCRPPFDDSHPFTACHRGPLLLPSLRMTPFDSLENLLEEGDIQVLISHKKTSLKKAVYRELCLRPVVCLCGCTTSTGPVGTGLCASIFVMLEEWPSAGHPFSTELLDVQSQVVSGRNSEQILFCDNLEILYTLVEAGLAFAIISGPLFRSLFPHLRYIPMPELSHLLWCFLPCRENSPPCFGDFSLCWRKIYKPIPMRYDHCTPNVPTLSQVGTFDASISKLD